jgi:hypothetical protein
MKTQQVEQLLDQLLARLYPADAPSGQPTLSVDEPAENLASYREQLTIVRRRIVRHHADELQSTLDALGEGQPIAFAASFELMSNLCRLHYLELRILSLELRRATHIKYTSVNYDDASVGCKRGPSRKKESAKSAARGKRRG